MDERRSRRRAGKIAAGCARTLLATIALACGKAADTTDSPRDAHALAITRQFEDGVEIVAGIAGLPGGRIAVGDAGRYEVVVFDSIGRRLHRIGRRGQGPGEFSLIRAVSRCLGDSIVVSDFGSGHLSVLGDSSVVRRIELPPQLSTADLLGCRGPEAVFSRLPDVLPGKGTQWFPLTVLTLDLRTGAMSWMASLKGTEMTVATRVPAFFERPFGRQTLLGVGGGLVVHAQSDEPFVVARGSGGTPITIPFASGPPRSVTTSDREMLLRERTSEMWDKESRSNLRAVYAEADWGPTFPLLDRLMVDETGRVWIRRPNVSDDSLQTWTRLTASPADSMSVRIPRRFRVVAAQQDRLLGVSESAEGMQQVGWVQLQSLSARGTKSR